MALLIWRHSDENFQGVSMLHCGHGIVTGVTVAAGTVAATYGRIKGYCQLQERA